MSKLNLIFKLCTGGALGITAVSCAVYVEAKKEIQHQAIVVSLESGMMNDFLKCANARIVEQSEIWDTPPIVDVARKFGEKDGFPSLEGGALRVQTALPDNVRGNVATIVTEIDRDMGTATKLRYNHVGPAHEAQHEVVVRVVSSCLNARGPMA